MLRTTRSKRIGERTERPTNIRFGFPTVWRGVPGFSWLRTANVGVTMTRPLRDAFDVGKHNVEEMGNEAQFYTDLAMGLVEFKSCGQSSLLKKLQNS